MIPRERVQSLNQRDGRVDYAQVVKQKMPLLHESADWFLRNASGAHRARFDKFVTENSWWLEDYVLFEALRIRHEQRSWNTWPHDLAHREPKRWTQSARSCAMNWTAPIPSVCVFRTVAALHTYCQIKGVKIIGDVAIFVSYDSADVWTHPDTFRLDAKTLDPEFVAGVPPDSFQRRDSAGKPAVSVAGVEAARIRLVGEADELVAGELRHHSPRSFPRLSAILGDSQQRAHGGAWALGRWPGQ